MRVLGIPCRVVTNFDSAHDTNGNLLIEEFYTETGKKLNHSKDSIWWVVISLFFPDMINSFGEFPMQPWFFTFGIVLKQLFLFCEANKPLHALLISSFGSSKQELPRLGGVLDDPPGSWKGNGWLAGSGPDPSGEERRCVRHFLDVRKFSRLHSTLKVLPNKRDFLSLLGVFCCGPAPVKAIKGRRIDLFYDIPFVYAAVNADVHSIVLSEGRVLGYSKDTERVGSLICTKAVGYPRHQSLTGEYKYLKSMSPKLEIHIISAMVLSSRREKSLRTFFQSLHYRPHFNNFIKKLHNVRRLNIKKR